MKICKHCGQAINEYRHHRFDYDEEGAIEFTGRSKDGDIWDIWRYPGSSLNPGDSKRGKWNDRVGLFAE